MPSSSCASPLRLLGLAAAVAGAAAGNYVFVAVSGGLQHGFVDHKYLHYHQGEADEVPAVFWGTALVRGYKAFLDIKQETWREYKPDPQTPHVNPAVIVSGCWEHANIYFIYAIDERQAVAALNSEPRFLSMTPDTGLVELAAEETSDSIRATAARQIKLDGSGDSEHVSFLTVTAVWFQDSYVESPVLYTKPDGTEVTDFVNSVATWAGTTSAARENPDTAEKYAATVVKAIRAAEAAGIPGSTVRPPYTCKSPARYGVGPQTTRMNKVYSACELSEVAALAGVSYTAPADCSCTEES